MNAFIFSSEFEPQAVHRARVPAGIQTEVELLLAISEVLRFPDYFGCNWDAVDECIRDLSWLPPGDVTLAHEDLPLPSHRASLSTYLSVLVDAIENLNTTGSNLIFASPEEYDPSGENAFLLKRKLYVVFPPEVRNIVESVLADHKNRQ